MTLDDGTNSITCPHCSVRVYVDDFCRPIADRARAADEYGPRTYVIIGNNRLLHSCELFEDE